MEVECTNMDTTAFYEKEDDKNTAFTWEVRANNHAFHATSTEKRFLCWRKKKYNTNKICTAKYNVFTFLPLNLYEQFHRASNIYFLIIIILQSIPEISTLPWFTLFAPLVCLLFIRAIRDLVDDIGRHRSDRAINNRPCQILRRKRFKWKKWEDICVGDVVCLKKDSIVPADLLLLVSTEPSSLCYVETADIDGETNLKFKQALTVTHQELTSSKNMESFQGTVLCEEPNSRMHHFVGSLEWNKKTYSLDIGNMLLRGYKIRNVEACYGLVIYAGVDTKIMKNCGKIHLKRTKVDLFMNKLVAMIFLSLVIISLLLTLGFSFNIKDFKWKHYYVSANHLKSEIAECFLIFWSFLILLSTMVPMALFIMAEFVYLGNSLFIDWDMQMYYEPRDATAKARNTSLADQLGQVQYIFSDKTGTLTQNIMTFKKCCINGQVYGPDDEETPRQENPYLWNEFADGKFLFYDKKLLHVVRHKKDRVVQEFWRLLAICHTVMVQEENDQPLYQAASPDEEALVTAARNFGYVFRSRTQDSITVMEMGEERIYQVLAMMDFNSVRKRMSVLVRNPEGSICLYTKGADTVILERLHKKGEMEMTTEEVLAAFAEQTLRTLCLAYKEIDEDDYEEWESQHHEATLLLQNRAQALHQVYDKMEQNLQLLGVTAIEDKLQDHVSEAISSLKRANIKVWVLTGDKRETALNIGFACQLLEENMLILEDKEIKRILEIYWENVSKLQTSKGNLKILPQINMAMVISGDFLDQLMFSLHQKPQALTDVEEVNEVWQEPRQMRKNFPRARRISHLFQNLGTSQDPLSTKVLNTNENFEMWRERAFVELASRCQAVICCRMTPKQKALVVGLVKKYQQVVTLAIGDGANDVNMIKTADIGVGLMGQEGMQAVQNSDYMLAQFCFLQRLLLVHGRWSYMRVSKFLSFFFYKTVACMMAQIWFSFYNGFTAQPLYEGWFLSFTNMFYTTLPVLYMGLFEQDVSAEQSLSMPQLYMMGQKDALFNYGVFFQAISHGLVTSMINFIITLLASQDSPSDYQSFAVLVALSGLLSITIEAILIIKYWTIICVACILLSLGSYAVLTSLTQSFWLYKIAPKTFPFLYADYNALTQLHGLLVILLNVTLNTLFVLAFRVIQLLRQLRPKEEEVPKEEVLGVEAVPYLPRESRARRSSYAFSHHEGYADLITHGTILRRPHEAPSEPLYASPIPSEGEEEEPSTGRKRSLWLPRKTSSWLRRSRHHTAKDLAEDRAAFSAQSSSVTASTPSVLYSESQASRPSRSPTTISMPSRSSQKMSSPPGSQPSLAEDWRLVSPSEPPFQTWESQPDSLEGRSQSWTPFWKNWQKETHPLGEDAESLPRLTHTAPPKTLPPSVDEEPLHRKNIRVQLHVLPDRRRWLHKMDAKIALSSEPGSSPCTEGNKEKERPKSALELERKPRLSKGGGRSADEETKVERQACARSLGRTALTQDYPDSCDLRAQSIAQERRGEGGPA
ncbi:phospholipid-transporting ATPase IK-like [Dipodomys spectabilis]|uniref:phospholipid-transporting ATPase IK-like n=1 Tax=Dipodomys spectabilis TaxID=105255 RepID=UPI001C549C52|nr:phospholipid-transporting ATPase IK-like [Dipodomys spectabilis]